MRSPLATASDRTLWTFLLLLLVLSHGIAAELSTRHAAASDELAAREDDLSIRDAQIAKLQDRLDGALEHIHDRRDAAVAEGADPGA